MAEKYQYLVLFFGYCCFVVFFFEEAGSNSGSNFYSLFYRIKARLSDGAGRVSEIVGIRVLDVRVSSCKNTQNGME